MVKPQSFIITASTILMCFLFNIHILADARADQKQADEVAKTLKDVDNPDDSIKVLYDVYSLSSRSNRKDVGLQILDIADRTNNQEVLTDILNRLSSKMEDTDGLERLLEISSHIPQDSMRRGVELLLEMEMANSLASKESETTRKNKVIDLAYASSINKQDIYEEIIDLYRTLVYLNPSSQGSLYLEYLTRLGDLVDQLPDDEFAIKNIYYTAASTYYTRHRNNKKAIECNKKLLELVSKLENQVGKLGNLPQNFDYFKYICYRRLLANFKGLSAEEVDSIYNQCVLLAERNEDVAESFGNRNVSKSYYYFSKGMYPEAITHLKKAVTLDDISDFRRQELLALLAEAQEATGDDEGLLKTLKQYAKLLNQEIYNGEEDIYHELEIRNSVNRLTLEERKEQEIQREENRRMRRISLTLSYAFAIIIIFMCRAYFKLRQRVKVIELQNKTLHTNMDQIFDNGIPYGTTDLHKKKSKLKG